MNTVVASFSGAKYALCQQYFFLINCDLLMIVTEMQPFDQVTELSYLFEHECRERSLRVNHMCRKLILVFLFVVARVDACVPASVQLFA